MLDDVIDRVKILAVLIWDDDTSGEFDAEAAGVFDARVVDVTDTDGESLTLDVNVPWDGVVI
jgi:hypothetical protein